MDINVVLSVLMFLSLGTVVGFLSGLLGVGGGGILVPMLASIFVFIGIGDTHVLQMALGTSLACSLPTTATSAYAHHKKESVLWKTVQHMSLGVVLGSVLGIALATKLDGKYLALIFAVFMSLVAVKMFNNWQPTPRKSPMPKLITMITGACIGMISALISVGGAFFTILYLNYAGAELKKAIGTSSAIGFVAVSVSTLGYLLLSPPSEVTQVPYSFGYIYVPALCLVTLASVVMVPVGTRVSHNLPNKKLKQIIGVLCVFLSIKLLYSMMG